MVVPVFKNFFVGTGLGIFISNKKTDRINSNFTFGEKLFVGIRLGDKCVELTCRHFSNGDLTEQNSGYNFVGASVTRNFQA